MILYVREKEYELENSVEGLEEIYKILDKETRNEYSLSHFIIDGQEVYENYEGYLEDNIFSIDKVSMILLTQEEFITEVLKTSSDYIKNSMSRIEILSNSFSKSPTYKDWDEITDLFEAIGWMINVFQTIDVIENLSDKISDYEKWNQYALEVKSLSEIVLELNEAMESNDNNMIGDLLSYEIVPTMKNMELKLSELI